MGQGEDARLVEMPGQLGRQPRNTGGGDDERQRRRSEIGQRQAGGGQHEPCTQYHGSAFLAMSTRTTPGSVSFVSCTNPRASSCG